jgi:hypothetical protein
MHINYIILETFSRRLKQIDAKNRLHHRRHRTLVAHVDRVRLCL